MCVQCKRCFNLNNSVFDRIGRTASIPYNPTINGNLVLVVKNLYTKALNRQASARRTLSHFKYRIWTDLTVNGSDAIKIKHLPLFDCTLFAVSWCPKANSEHIKPFHLHTYRTLFASHLQLYGFIGNAPLIVSEYTYRNNRQKHVCAIYCYKTSNKPKACARALKNTL